MNALPDPIVVDFVVVVCRGCARESTVYPDRPLRGAQEIIDWIEGKDGGGLAAQGCSCGASHCDLKMHVVGNGG